MTKLYFTVTGIPEQLGPRPDGNRRTLTLGEIETIMWRDRQFVIPVVGDCMEQAGIVDGGWIAVDTTHFPAPPRYKSKGGDGTEDVCLCYAVFPGQHRPAVMVKSYIGVWGASLTLSTRYDLTKGEHPYNLGMEALGIFGVIYASWDSNGRLLWQREPESFSDKLGAAPTIHGINIEEPVPIKGVAV